MHGTLGLRDMETTQGNDDRAWYVLRIGGNREGTVRQYFSPTDQEIEEAAAISRQLAAHLIGRRFKIYIPMERKKVTRGAARTKVIIERPLFIGYGFIRISWDEDQSRLHHIRNAPGVLGFVQLGDAYAVVSDKDMAKIGDEESKARDITKRRGGEWKVGQEMRVKEGPFAGFPARIDLLTDSERIRALVDIFGRKTPIWFEDEQLEKL